MRAILVPVLLLAVLPALVAAGDEAGDHFARGDVLLAKGDFDGAAAAYAAAARADPENEEYAGRALVLQRVVSLRAIVAKSEPSEKWQRMVASLHGFYLENRLLAVAAAEAEKAHERSATPFTTALLAEALLERGDDAGAERILETLAEDRRDARHHVFLAIAKAGLGKRAEAVAALELAPLAEDAGPAPIYNRARVEARLGKPAEAVRLLVLCLERTPPRSLEAVRDGIRACADFEKLPEEEMARAMATESKVKESDCSTGSGCGSCPSRGECGK